MYAIRSYYGSFFSKVGFHLTNGSLTIHVITSYSIHYTKLYDVHLDENGEVLTPLYNYTKPLDKEIVDSFLGKYGPKEEFLSTTGCFDLSLLNSGMQLYWLKYSKPEVFRKIKYSLHLPQYLSYIFTSIPLSEYTSIGCHSYNFV